MKMRTYGVVPIALFTLLRMGEAYAETEPAEITIHLSDGHKGVVLALLEAVDDGTPVTGIAALDSLAATYGLIGIYRRDSRSSGFYGYRFRLTFPPGADVDAMAGAYGNLFYCTIGRRRGREAPGSFVAPHPLYRWRGTGNQSDFRKDMRRQCFEYRFIGRTPASASAARGRRQPNLCGCSFKLVFRPSGRIPAWRELSRSS